MNEILTPDYAEFKLSTSQKLALKICGRAKIGQIRLGRRAGTPIFVAKCSTHGLYADTTHGYGNTLRCQKCMRELVELQYAKL